MCCLQNTTDQLECLSVYECVFSVCVSVSMWEHVHFQAAYSYFKSFHRPVVEVYSYHLSAWEWSDLCVYVCVCVCVCVGMCACLCVCLLKHEGIWSSLCVRVVFEPALCAWTNPVLMVVCSLIMPCDGTPNGSHLPRVKGNCV